MRFGFIGCGVISTYHAGAVATLGETSSLVSVYDLDTDRARVFAAEYGCAAEPTLDMLLARDDVDAVAICVASGLHADIAVAALNAGKHVLVEKPIDITLDAADRIIDAEKASGKIVTIISQRRFEPAPMFLRRALDNGALGTITSGIAECTWWRSPQYYASAEWRGTWAMDGGGALMNQGVHQADLLTWMMGEPVEVTAFADTLAHEGLEVEDTVAAVVRFASGAIGTLSATTAANPGLPLRLSVHGDRGTAVIEGAALKTFTLAEADPTADSASTVADRFTREASQVRNLRSDHHAGMNHPAQYADFVDAVNTGRPPLVTSADGRRALELVLAVYESTRSGKPVTIGAA